MNASQRRPGSGSTLRALGSLEAVRRAEAGAEGSTESPGKRRRLEDDEDGGKMEEKIGFSGTGTYASSMLGASRSVPDFRSSTTTPAATPQKPTAGAASTSPFTFSVPFSSSTTPQQTPQSSVPDSTRATTISAKPSQSLTSGLSRYSRQPSLVAPSPLRHSTSFDSPDGKKSPNNAKKASGPSLAAETVKKTQAAQMVMDLIEEEEAAQVCTGGYRLSPPPPLPLLAGVFDSFQ